MTTYAIKNLSDAEEACYQVCDQDGCEFETYDSLEDAANDVENRIAEDKAQSDLDAIEAYVTSLDPTQPVDRARLAYLAEIIRKM